MKKAHLFILFIFGIYVQGQDSLTTQTPKFRIGVFTSVDFNLAKKNYPTSANTGFDATYNHLNYSVGFIGEYFLLEKISLNVGVNYSNKHLSGLSYCHVCQYSMPPPPRTVRLQYFEIPISARYYIPLNQVSFFGEVGAVNQFAQGSFSQFAETKETGYVLGIKLGTGIELKLTEFMGLQFGVDYQKGLTNLLNYIDVKNESVGIKLGFVKSF